MKVVLAIVTSLDGKSTKGFKPPKLWASKEDQLHFQSLISKNNVIVMGKNTYTVSKDIIKLSKNKLRIVMARDINEFKGAVVSNQLEFSSESPKQLIKRLTKQGFKQMLLVSGPKLNSAFLKAGLVNELWITLEPNIFGAGIGLVDSEKLDVKLKLLSSKKLNAQGTLLLKYQVI
jgi:riboflavin biosynthesis pyrimidine reductase